ncbi:dienelactone hydrolase family protein [Qipengyuania seohaensis]|uniref:dienelactone hydrolase family protein n=1 Tax=Qipengyuania seohaensis TaxID=266951 RepID=UPI000C223173|nr:dienelactone hydrolase family protein [Qipengyuania seohaensis]
MCDQERLAKWAQSGISRRTFGAGALAGTAAACTSMEPAGDDAAENIIMRSSVSFTTPDGTMDGEFFHPSSGTYPSVILWPDIAGIRPAKRLMAIRLSEAGYAVLLANPYYRDVSGQQFEDFADFAGNGGWDKVKPWRARFDHETISRDNAACAAWLQEQSAVEPNRGVGVQGYCMTGNFAVLGPWSEDMISAGASFHGGGLVRDSEFSPHRLLQDDGHYLIAISQDDDAKQPEAKTALRAAAQDVNNRTEIEVYPADHGWCVPDSPAYDQEQAERAWARLLVLYEEAL